MTAGRRVLITGVRGLVGQVLRTALAEDYQVAGVDVRRGRDGLVRSDMARLRHAERAVDGADVVIDLASAHWRQPWDVVRDNNIDQALKALKKKLQREGVFREMKLRRHYEKPSERRAREAAEAVRRARKVERKRLEREGF